MIDSTESAHLAIAFHSAFATTYVRLARQKYPRHFGHFPFHSQDVHVIHGGNHWWHIVCLPGQRDGMLNLGPIGRYTLQAADAESYPDLADLHDDNVPRKEEFRLAMGVDACIYHEAFAPPIPGHEQLAGAAAALAARLVDADAAEFLELEALKSKLSSMRNAHQFLHDLSEARSCLRSGHHRAAVVTCCATAESAVVGRLEEMGHAIRQEERNRVLGHEHHSFPAMVHEVYRGGRISVKTRDALETLNSLRRGAEHCRPDATLQDDAAFAWATLVQLLRELAK
jgi:hypothetical protein